MEKNGRERRRFKVHTRREDTECLDGASSYCTTFNDIKKIKKCLTFTETFHPFIYIMCVRTEHHDRPTIY